MEVKIISETAFTSIDEKNKYEYQNINYFKINNIDEIIRFYGSDSLKHFGLNHLSGALTGNLFATLYDISSENEAHTAAIDTNRKITAILDFMWFVKDNSFNTPCTSYITDNGSMWQLYSTNNRTLADGRHTTLNISIEEWNESISYLTIFNQESTKAKDFEVTQPVNEGRDAIKSPMSEIEYNSLNRLNRTMSFLVQARNGSFLPSKISNYILMAECLFSADDNKEITYKIAQRIANYIGSSIVEKKQIFKFIKKAYDVRSKYLHGQPLSKGSKTNEILAEISVELDEVMRRVMRKVFTEPKKFTVSDNAIFSEWLDENMFSEKTLLNDNPASSTETPII